jgi:uncharacterized Ntn-hydrolase superfamily protein
VHRIKPVNTFSIVACDLDEQAWGVAVASKFLAAAAVVSWAQASVGAVATQALAKVGYGPEGLALLAIGKSAAETLETLLAADSGAAQRQAAIVDSRGGVAAHTGEACYAWAGHKTGEGFSCQGNILTGPETLDAMARAFTAGSGELADRLVQALLAGDLVGGDRRGKQSAGVLVVRPQGGYGGDTDRYLDLRVDDHPEPVQELQRLVTAHHVFFGEARPEDLRRIDKALARELQALMKTAGHYAGEGHGRWDAASKQAFWALVGNENLEERWNLKGDPDHIDLTTLHYLRGRFGAAG